MKNSFYIIGTLFLAGCSSLSTRQPFEKSLQACRSAEQQFHKTAGEANPAEGVRAIKSVVPDYPKSALNNRTEGCVTLAFDLDGSGSPVNVKVVAEEPANRWFRESALSAIAGEQYPKTVAKNQILVMQFHLPLPPFQSDAEAAGEKLNGPNNSYR